MGLAKNLKIRGRKEKEGDPPDPLSICLERFKQTGRAKDWEDVQSKVNDLLAKKTAKRGFSKQEIADLQENIPFQLFLVLESLPVTQGRVKDLQKYLSQSISNMIADYIKARVKDRKAIESAKEKERLDQEIDDAENRSRFKGQ